MGRGNLVGVPVVAVGGGFGEGDRPEGGQGSADATQPAVRFSEGRRPETATRVELPEFAGPLALLLSLIEARQLDILTVPLGALADAYLDALAGLEADRLGNVSSFVTIASQLILIKSRAMLPRRPDPADPTALADEGPDPEAELRARLILYRAYRDAGMRLATEAALRVGLFRREPAVAQAAGLAGAQPVGQPPLDPMRLARALDRLAAIAIPPDLPPEAMARTVTITERAQLIRDALRGASVVVLQDLLAGVRDRVVIAVTFLAMLELMKRREIVVEQAEPWGPIVARATTSAERLAAGISAEASDAPLDETLESFA
jgi:segregation and condensation protein A